MAVLVVYLDNCAPAIFLIFMGFACRWGNKLSTKLFVGREFVIKHIKLKHSAVVDAEREKASTKQDASQNLLIDFILV